MEEPTDPMMHQMALSALTTEHVNLESARVATISEANGRSALYLGTLSSAVIAFAFIEQASEMGDAFYLFGLTMLSSVFLLGVFTYLRLVQTSIEDIVYTVATFRIREYFVRLDPTAAPFFPPTDPEGIKKLERMGFLPRTGLQAFLTAASMVGCINAMESLRCDRFAHSSLPVVVRSRAGAYSPAAAGTLTRPEDDVASGANRVRTRTCLLIRRPT